MNEKITHNAQKYPFLQRPDGRLNDLLEKNKVKSRGSVMLEESQSTWVEVGCWAQTKAIYYQLSCLLIKNILEKFPKY